MLLSTHLFYIHDKPIPCHHDLGPSDLGWRKTPPDRNIGLDFVE